MITQPRSTSYRNVKTVVALTVLIAAMAGRNFLAATPDVLSFLFRVGSLGTGNSEFVFPIGLAVGGPANRIYVTDTQSADGDIKNDRIQVFETNGAPAFMFGESGTGPGQFNYPTGLAVDQNGKILVADTDNHRLQLFDAAGNHLQTIGGFGNFDVTDEANQDGGGNYIGPPPTGVFGPGPSSPVLGFNYPVRVALRPGTRLLDGSDTAGRVAVVDQLNHRVVVFNSMLVPQFAFGGFENNGNTMGSLRGPVGISMDLQRIYVAEPENHRVQIFNQSGVALSFFGSTAVGSADPQAENGPLDLSNPNDVHVDDQGHLIVADTDRSRILILEADPGTNMEPRCKDVGDSLVATRCAIVGSDGTRYDARVLGRDGTADGDFFYPQAVAVDSLARVVVVDTDRHRFQVFQGAKLAVASAAITTAGPVNFGGIVSLHVVLANQGATSLQVTPAVQPSLNGQLMSPPPTLSIAAGQTGAFDVDFVTNQPGTLTFTIGATGLTPTGAAVHATTRTSQNSVVVNPSANPQALATLATPAPARVGANGEITVTLTITNTGGVPLFDLAPAVSSAPTTLVTLLPGPALNTSALNPGMSRSFAFTFKASGIQTGVVAFQGSFSAQYSHLVSGLPTVFTLPVSGQPGVTAEVVSDDVPPVTQLVVSGTVGTVLPDITWYRSPIHIALNAIDGGSQVAFVNYQVTGLLGGFQGQIPGPSAGFDIAFENRVEVRYWAVDTSGNAETKRTIVLGVDRVLPDIFRSGLQPAPNAAGWINSSPTVSFGATDGSSGVAFVTAPQLVNTNGAEQTISGEARDRAGNSSTLTTKVSVDKLAPAVSCAPAAVPVANAAGWYTTPGIVTVNCQAADQVGLSGIQFLAVTCGPTVAPALTGSATLQRGPLTATASCAFNADGKYDVQATATDAAGNTSKSTKIQIKIDRTPPTVVCGTASGGEIWPPNHKMVVWNTFVTVTDLMSGSAGFKLTGYSSSEVVNGNGDGNTSVDMTGWTIGTPDTSGSVRAERAGPGTGRVYRLFYVGSDAAGNKTSCAGALIEVPHDQGKKK